LTRIPPRDRREIGLRALTSKRAVQRLCLAAGALVLTLGACTGDRVVIGARRCPARADGPPAVAPLPSAQQREFQRYELMAWVHFGLATYDQSPGAPASEFNPTSFDAHQWAAALASAGFHQVVLVAKHYDGFCLWPSAYTDYSVKASPWRGGKGDLAREFTDAAREAGLRVGLYLSPWGEN